MVDPFCGGPLLEMTKTLKKLFITAAKNWLLLTDMRKHNTGYTTELIFYVVNYLLSGLYLTDVLCFTKSGNFKSYIADFQVTVSLSLSLGLNQCK